MICKNLFLTFCLFLLKVSDMFSTLIKQLNDDNEADTWAKAYNNRGHAKYMAVDFDEALQDYELALKTGWKLI